jgi:hypothetical protein
MPAHSVAYLEDLRNQECRRSGYEHIELPAVIIRYE